MLIKHLRVKECILMTINVKVSCNSIKKKNWNRVERLFVWFICSSYWKKNNQLSAFVVRIKDINARKKTGYIIIIRIIIWY